MSALAAIGAIVTCTHFFVDLQNLAVLADVKRPSVRKRARKRYHAVSLGRLLRGVAQDGVIQPQIDLAKLMLPRLPSAGSQLAVKVGDIKFPQFIAVRTERLALGRSAPGKCLGEPGDHHRLFAFVIGELVGFAVAARQREVRCCVANLQISRTEESPVRNPAIMS